MEAVQLPAWHGGRCPALCQQRPCCLTPPVALLSCAPHSLHCSPIHPSHPLTVPIHPSIPLQLPGALCGHEEPDPAGDAAAAGRAAEIQRRRPGGPGTGGDATQRLGARVAAGCYAALGGLHWSPCLTLPHLPAIAVPLCSRRMRGPPTWQALCRTCRWGAGLLCCLGMPHASTWHAATCFAPYHLEPAWEHAFAHS